MKIVCTTVYNFEELPSLSQEVAINKHIRFIMECQPYDEMSENMKKAVDKAESLQTPWFTGGYIYDYCKDEIIEEIKLNEYDFYEDGELKDSRLSEVA